MNELFKGALLIGAFVLLGDCTPRKTKKILRESRKTFKKKGKKKMRTAFSSGRKKSKLKKRGKRSKARFSKQKRGRKK